MLPQMLHSVNTHLDVMLAPPYPKTQHDKNIWIPSHDTSIAFPPPVLERWIPPLWVPPNKDQGFWLAQQVICYQRGYYPGALFRQFMGVVAECFEEKVEESIENINRLAYDFFIAVVSHDRRPIAGCVVEFRPPASPHDTPYLYVSTVCTDPSYGSKGLAHQLIHSVYTLGTLLIEQNATAPGIWRNAIPDRRLYIGLTVLRTYSNAADRLVRLYTQCGLSNHRGWGHITYNSFTPYSIYEWQLEKQPDKTPMWQSIAPGVLYEDAQICILHPETPGGSSMYHTFPERHMQAVQSAGIIHPKHAFLHKDPSKIYTPDEIHFHRQPPTAGGAFRIQVRSKIETLELRISVPAWFAIDIKHTAMH
jgi:hypothetical protein